MPDPVITLSVVKSLEPSDETSQELGNKFPWAPDDKREFWCEKHSSLVKLTGDVNAEGTYYVVKVGEGYYRRYPVFGRDLVPRNQAPASAQSTEKLAINKATWGEIKNFLIDKFIPSYPWSAKNGKTPSETREAMDAITKSKNKGLAKMIEDERSSSYGVFDGHENFTIRMTAVYESFPWAEFSQSLDYTH